MTPRRLDPALIHERLREIQLLLAALVEVGEVDAERLRRDRLTRHVVERVLSQIVELAGSITPTSWQHGLAARRAVTPTHSTRSREPGYSNGTLPQQDGQYVRHVAHWLGSHAAATSHPSGNT